MGATTHKKLHMVVTVVLLVTIASPVSAMAATRTDTNPVALALTRAEAYWHDRPCGGQISVVLGGTLPRDPTPPPSAPGSPPFALSMWVSFATPLGEDDFAAAPATYTNCVVHLSPTAWPNWRHDDLYFPYFCQAITHELGHFEGHSDVNAPPGTIYAANLEGVPIVPPCRHYRLVFYLGAGDYEISQGST